MKKKSFIFFFLVLPLFFSTGIFAGSIDYLSSQSADYVRTLSRNASTDADAVHYNPAGTAFMKDGFYLYLSNQVILMDWSSTLKSTGIKYESKVTVPAVPNFYAIYKKENWAIQLGSGILAGGGNVDFKNSVPTLVLLQSYFGAFQSGYLEGLSIYPFFSVGASYALSNMFSVSVSGRYVYSLKTYKAKATYAAPLTLELDAEETAQGIGGILSVNVKPYHNLLLSLQFETATRLNFKTKINNGKDFNAGAGPMFFKDGYSRRKDLPAGLSFGVSYAPSQQLIFTGSLNTFFIGYAGGTYNDTLTTDIYAKNGYNQEYDKIGWEAGLSAEYALKPNFLSLSIGYLYSKVGGNDRVVNDFEFSLDAHTVGLGGKLTLMENMDLSLGVSRVFYVESDGLYNTAAGATLANYKKAFWIFALGLQYKL